LPDELNQVWINLIHNALQAMNHKGTLSRIAHARVHAHAPKRINAPNPETPRPMFAHPCRDQTMRRFA
jgi:hypothetical protein